jgi:hypothetical protein
MLKQRILLMIGFLLFGCSPITRSTSILPTLYTTPVPLNTIQPSPPPPTLIPTLSETSTVVPSETATELVTIPPIETSIPLVYFFPVQPTTGADFAEGVASHGYPATDIFSPEGSEFVAVTNGIVDFVSYEDRWDSNNDDLALRGGLCVAIIGDDQVRYYGSHLSAIEPGISPGIRVVAGQVLGYVGHTGNARGTLPHVHFGISRPSYPEDWRSRRGEVDPFPFLISWKDGLNLTPQLTNP